MAGEKLRLGIAAVTAVISTSCINSESLSEYKKASAPVSSTPCDRDPNSEQEIYNCKGAKIAVVSKSATFVQADVTVTNIGVPETGNTIRIGTRLDDNSGSGLTVRTGDNSIVVLKDLTEDTSNRFKPREIMYPAVAVTIKDLDTIPPDGIVCPIISGGTSKAGRHASLYNCNEKLNITVRGADANKERLEVSVEQSDGVNPLGARARVNIDSNQVLFTNFPDGQKVAVINSKGLIEVIHQKSN
jgi:hypothetical protein